MSPVERRSRVGGKLGGLIATVVVASVLVGGSSLVVGGSAPSGGSGQQGSCPLPAYPDESCTGVPSGITLTAYTGPRIITTDNTIVDGKIITDCPLAIYATGVIVRNSRFDCVEQGGIYVDDAASYARSINGTQPIVLVEDSTINCNGTTTSGPSGVVEAHFHLRRVEIRECENGISAGQNAIIEDSLIWRLDNRGTDPHEDSIQFTAGHWTGSAYVCNPGCSANITIRHNTIISMAGDSLVNFGTSAIITNPGGDDNILIEDNLLAGGGYTIYCPRPGQGVNFRLINNRFSTEFFPTSGFLASNDDCGDETHSGNVYYPSGTPIPMNDY